MLLSLHRHDDGVETQDGLRVVYDVVGNRAFFGAASVAGPALVFELHEGEAPGALLCARVELDAAIDWLVRCDRVDFPPGGVAYLHTHPGPGIRCLLEGEIRIETEGKTATYRPYEAWFERGPDPVLAAASPTRKTAFVRVMLLPREWEGKRTIRYVDPRDAEKPKTQRATILLERPLAL